MDKTYLMRIDEVGFFSSMAWTYCCVIILLMYVIKALLLGRIFKKAGEKVWKAWVPFVNIWTYFKIAGYKGCLTFKLILSLVIFHLAMCVEPGVFQAILYIISAILFVCFFVFMVAAGISIQKKLGKPLPFIILMFINLIAPLWMWILALDYSKWDNKKGRVVKKKKSKK